MLFIENLRLLRSADTVILLHTTNAFFLDNRLTDGGEVVSPTRRPPFTPKKIPGTHFC
jgi:hypothetical protein